MASLTARLVSHSLNLHGRSESTTTNVCFGLGHRSQHPILHRSTLSPYSLRISNVSLSRKSCCAQRQIPYLACSRPDTCPRNAIWNLQGSRRRPGRVQKKSNRESNGKLETQNIISENNSHLQWKIIPLADSKDDTKYQIKNDMNCGILGITKSKDDADDAFVNCSLQEYFWTIEPRGRSFVCGFHVIR
jgi:hypothetical protein